MVYVDVYRVSTSIQTFVNKDLPAVKDIEKLDSNAHVNFDLVSKKKIGTRKS